MDEDKKQPENETIDWQKQCEELDHKYKLALADYQNLLKQTAKERVELALYANEALLLEMIPVYDNLKLTLKHYPKDADANWRTGLEHVLSQFKKAFEDNGLKEIKTEEAKFDPTAMEAVETRETKEKAEDDMVAEELKGGYMYHDKVLIPARVAVYKLTN